MFKEDIFNNFVRLNRGFDLPDSAIEHGDFPVVASTSIKARHREYRLKAPGVVTGRSGSLGTVQYINENYWPLNTSLYVKDFKGNHPRFVYYFLQQMHLENFNSGAGVPSLNQNHLHKVKIKIPNYDVQKRIAAVLSTYDDLIETSQQRIELLEKMGEELYREWFVRLRFPGHKKVKMIKGVPEDWQVKTLDNIVEYYIGGGWGEDDQSTSFSEAAYVIRGTDIPHIQKGNFTACPFRFHTPSNLKSRKLQTNDFVFEVSGGSTNQLLGRNIHITESFLNFFDAPVIAASFCKLIRFQQEQVSSYFMKYFMKLYYDCDLVGIYQIQSTGISNYQFESFLKYQTIALPPKELQKNFDDLIMPILDMRDKISLANIQLKKSRDLLLPRLISGKLSVEQLDIQFPPSMLDEAATLETLQTRS